MATVLLGILATCVFTTVGLLRDVRRAAAGEQQALLVLDNVVERLAGESAWAPATVEGLLQAEFAASDLGRARGVVASGEPLGSGLRLVIRDARGKPLAAVTVPASRPGGAP